MDSNKKTEEVKDPKEEMFNVFGQNLGVFGLEVDKQSSASLKKVLKIIVGYPLSINADELNNSTELSEQEKSLAKVGCALKEQVINMFLQEQYEELTPSEKPKEESDE